MDQKTCRSYVEYNPNTGKMFWNNPSRYCPSKAGEEAGGVRTVKAKGGVYQYHKITIDWKVWSRARLAFLYMTGEIPARILHRNGKSLDDRWCNLAAGYRLPDGVEKRYKGRYASFTTMHGKRFPLGIFASVEEAVAAQTLVEV